MSTDKDPTLHWWHLTANVTTHVVLLRTETPMFDQQTCQGLPTPLASDPVRYETYLHAYLPGHDPSLVLQGAAAEGCAPISAARKGCPPLIHEQSCRPHLGLLQAEAAGPSAAEMTYSLLGEGQVHHHPCQWRKNCMSKQRNKWRSEQSASLAVHGPEKSYNPVLCLPTGPNREMRIPTWKAGSR